jgi:hypothetical protein
VQPRLCFLPAFLILSPFAANLPAEASPLSADYNFLQSLCMSQTYQIPDAVVSETPLTAQLAANASALELKTHRGAQTPRGFAGIASELQALVQGAGVFDLGYRTFVLLEETAFAG